MRTEALTAERETAVQEWRPGQVLPGSGGLRLLRRLDGGGTADVWEACGPGGLVAVKTLRLALVGRPGLTGALLREARKGALVSHPSLVRALGSGMDGARPYVVFELLRGTSLAASGLSGLSRLRVARLLRGPAAALARLHAAGLVHGDVKPGNLFIEGNGTVRLLDLGAARMAADSALDSTGWVPPRGMPAVTPDWAAPERLRGDAPDIRDDVHSLARVATALLKGPPTRALRDALGPRAGRPACPVAVVRSLLPSVWFGGPAWRG